MSSGALPLDSSDLIFSIYSFSAAAAAAEALATEPVVKPNLGVVLSYY